MPLEVLKPRNGAAQRKPQVLSDASLSFSFKIPASLARARSPRSAKNSPEPAVSANKMDRLAANDKENTDISWENRDWDDQTPVIKREKSIGNSIDNVQSDDDDDVDGKPRATTHQDQWEELPTPDLPDDFPVLIVNLSRVQREHFPPSQDAEDSDTMQDVYDTIKTTLHRHFSHMVEALFEQKSCFHCTYGTSRAMLENLHNAYPNDVFALIDYPVEIDGIALHEFIYILSRPSRWKSIDYLKDCLRKCSRDIKWKMDVALELELLAEQEHDHRTKEQNRLGTEIDELTRLRDSFREKLVKVNSNDKKMNGQYLMLRKLEDIENRLLILLDAYLQEPELEEEECYGIFDGSGSGSPTAGMNILDMVVAMIFGRLPRDFSGCMVNETHFQMLFDHHMHIRRLWKNDFGRLPQKSNHVNENDDDDDAVNDFNNDERVLYEDQDQYKEELVTRKDLEDAYEVEESYNEAKASTSSIYDDWEAIHTENIDDDSDVQSVHSDGYGADYDSNESEDDESPVMIPSSISKTRTKSEKAVKESDGQPIRSHAGNIPQHRPTRRMKRPKKTKKTKKPKQTEDADAAPFQPFACTSAFSLLRIAKENEMF